MNRNLKAKVTKILIRMWPTYVGIDRLFHILKPPVPPDKPVVKKLSGFPLKLKFDPNTYMGMFLYYRGIYEEGIIKKLSELLKPGMVFIDVGANIGLYSVIGAYLVGDAGKVIAFEPQSGLESIFYENLRLNQLSNVALKSLALGKNSKPGKLYQVSRTNDGQATLSVKDNERYFGNPVDVTVQRLSDVLVNLGIEFVHGVKIDTEGAELDVLEGFRKWLEKKPPNFIFFECIENHLKRFGGDTATLIYYLKQFNYRIYCLYRGRWRSIESHIDHRKYAFSPDLLAVR
jgi:FkbM family methyltransferase